MSRLRSNILSFQLVMMFASGHDNYHLVALVIFQLRVLIIAVRTYTYELCSKNKAFSPSYLLSLPTLAHNLGPESPDTKP